MQGEPDRASRSRPLLRSGTRAIDCTRPRCLEHSRSGVDSGVVEPVRREQGEFDGLARALRGGVDSAAGRVESVLAITVETFGLHALSPRLLADAAGAGRGVSRAGSLLQPARERDPAAHADGGQVSHRSDRDDRQTIPCSLNAPCSWPDNQLKTWGSAPASGRDRGRRSRS